MLLPSMSSGRAGLAAAVHGSSVLLFGGDDGRLSVLNTAEKFDVLTEQWSPLPSMSSRRAYLATAVHGSSMLLFGGEDGPCRF